MSTLLDSAKITKPMEKAFSKELSNSTNLHTVIMGYTENQLVAAMAYERNGKNRLNILNRLYSRYAKIRGERERREIIYAGFDGLANAD